MAVISVVGRGGKTTIKTMIENVLDDVEVYEGVANKDCDLIVMAGMARPFKKEVIHFPHAFKMIVNADVNYRLKVPYASEVVDYGFSRKATVTASSVVQEDWSQTFTCCIQRSFNTINGSHVQPREFKVHINVPGKYNIYNTLASITVLLLLDTKDEIISDTLSKLKFVGNMEKLYDGEFSVIYNKISNPYQLFSVLESLSENEFNNLYIITDSFNCKSYGFIKKIADILREWYQIYSYTICMQNDNCTAYLKRLLQSYGIECLSDECGEAIRGILNRIGKGDMVLLLGDNNVIKKPWADFFNIEKE